MAHNRLSGDIFGRKSTISDMAVNAAITAESATISSSQAKLMFELQNLGCAGHGWLNGSQYAIGEQFL